MWIQKSVEGKTVQRGESLALHALFAAAVRNAEQGIGEEPLPLPVAYPCRGSIEAILTSAAAIEASAHEAAEPHISPDRFLDFCKVKREFRRLIGDTESHSVGKWIQVMTFYSDMDGDLLDLFRQVWDARTAFTHHKAREDSTTVKYERDVVNESLRGGGTFNLTSLDTEPHEIVWGAVERFGTPSFCWVVHEMLRSVLAWLARNGVVNLGSVAARERPPEPYFPRTRVEHHSLWRYWKHPPEGGAVVAARARVDDLMESLDSAAVAALSNLPGVLEDLRGDVVPSARSLGHLLAATGASL